MNCVTIDSSRALDPVRCMQNPNDQYYQLVTAAITQQQIVRGRELAVALRSSKVETKFATCKCVIYIWQSGS